MKSTKLKQKVNIIEASNLFSINKIENLKYSKSQPSKSLKIPRLNIRIKKTRILFQILPIELEQNRIEKQIL